LGIEFLNLEAKHFRRIVSLACIQHNAAFCEGKFWRVIQPISQIFNLIMRTSYVAGF
jgi:hypothetical protein